jgi:hypothetical protein
MKTYTIWTVSLDTFSKIDCMYVYYNRGHAVAKVRGLRRRLYSLNSNPNYDYYIYED